MLELWVERGFSSEKYAMQYFKKISFGKFQYSNCAVYN